MEISKLRCAFFQWILFPFFQPNPFRDVNCIFFDYCAISLFASVLCFSSTFVLLQISQCSHWKLLKIQIWNARWYFEEMEANNIRSHNFIIFIFKTSANFLKTKSIFTFRSRLFRSNIIAEKKISFPIAKNCVEYE